MAGVLVESWAERSEVSAVLEARGIEVSRGASLVLRGVSLSLHAGRVTGLLGPTGAGKTTLFEVLVGERTPERGSVWLLGADVTRKPLWRRARMGVGYIPQTPSVLPDLDVRGNLVSFERLVGGEGKGAAYWADLVGLGHRMSVRAGSLSGGERRLLEVARSLVARPRVLICDEPFSGIDPVGAMRVAETLRSRAGEGLAVLLSDHHASIALRVCDEAGLLLDGRMEVWGTPDELTSDGLVRERYLGGSMDG
jgi:lipopolysaccharide export system ATP-binding protein